MAEEFYNNKKDNVNFADSWLQNSVELALGGAVIAGAGTMAVKGDLTDSLRSGKKVIKSMGRGLDNYITRRSDPVARLLYRVGKKTYGNLGRMPKVTGQESNEKYIQLSKDYVKEVDTNPEIQEKMRREVTKRLGDRANRNLVDDALDGTNKYQNIDMKDQAGEIYQLVRDEEIKKRMGINVGNQSNRSHRSNNQAGEKKPWFDKRELAQTTVGGGLAGIALGAGVTGIHALDRLVQNPDTQKNIETSFNIGGSWMNKKEEAEMKKSAGSLEFYNRLKDIGRKTPEAVASGLGFTGVSLGTAKALENAKNNEEEPKSSRVIIELGNPDTTDEQNLATPPRMAGLPKLSSSDDNGFQKLALRSPAWIGNFAKDFKGYGPEIKQLEQMNYANAAASQLKSQDVDRLVKERYGNLVNDQTKGGFTTRLFDDQTNRVKQNAEQQIEDYQRRTADARLKAGAGALGIGGGLAGLAAMNRGREHGEVQ